ncbi:RssA protein [Actinobacillus ureae]|nr:RssA protein [Actinobacillus ureae]SUU49973.1 RssA protein [Actinobacillus ureae]
MKVGLVLEGGAMRGMFTAGVLDVFLDEQLELQTVPLSRLEKILQNYNKCMTLVLRSNQLPLYVSLWRLSPVSF